MKQVLFVGLLIFIIFVLFFNVYLSQQSSNLQMKEKYTKERLHNIELHSEILELKTLLETKLPKNEETKKFLEKNLPTVYGKEKKNDEKLQHEFWHSFGRDQHFSTCDKDYGFSLIKDWRKLKKEYSVPLTKSIKQTKVFCHKIRQRHHRGDDNFCHFENLYFSANTHGGNCRKNQQLWQQSAFQLELGNFMNYNFREIKDQCTKTLKGTTLLVDRDDVFNVFHSLANFINAFLSLLILNKKPKVDRLIILDSKTDGPYWPLWSSFSDKIIRRSSFGNEIVCLENAIFTIPGGSNFIWKDVWVPNDCYHSSLLKTFVRFTLKHFNLLEQPRRKKNDSPIRILLSSRQLKPGGPPGLKPGRRIINEKELENLLKNDLRTPEGKRVPTEVIVKDFSTIPLYEQIRLIRNTDVYIGMHGAGMTHLIFLPDEAVVIEMFPNGWHQSSMRNLAKLTNKIYLSWQNLHKKNIVEGNSNIIDLTEFQKIANSAVHIALSFHFGKGFL
eukprot:gene7551-11874_t